MLALICCLSMMATQTAYVQIKLVGTSYPTFSTSKLYLTEDTERNASYESGYDSQSAGTLSNDYSVLLYAFVGSEKCSSVATNDLTGLQIGFTTNNVDTEYKLKFSDFDGTEFKLYDRVAKQTVTLNASTPDYNFTAVAGQVEVNDRFVIGVPSYSVTMNVDGWASFSSLDDLEIPAGLTAYQGTLNGNELNLTSVDYIKAGQGVILYGDANQSYTLDLGNGSSVFTNDLKPSSAWASHSGTIYCLHNEGVGTTAFYQYTGSNMPANKAYLQISSSPSAAPKRITMRFNGATAIDNVEAESVKAEKFVENGEILIRRGNEVFNLQGQIVK